MHKRPKLAEALHLMRSIAPHSVDVQQALAQYEHMIQQGMEFQAARMVVDIVDHHNHNMELLANG